MPTATKSKLIGGMNKMEDFRMSPDCMLENNSNSIANELLKGTFVIGCDSINKELILQNVFHYSKKENRLEVYKLFPDKSNTRRNLQLDIAFVFVGKRNVLEEIIKILNISMNDYDFFVIDKYKNLYTKVVYDKYGKSMKLG